MTDEQLLDDMSAWSDYSRAIEELNAALFSEMVRRAMLNPGLYAESHAAIQRKS